MARIREFRGVLYNPRKIKDMAKVVTEPYDVISPLEQKAYYHLHPYNIIRLILGKHYPGDSGKSNQYTRAKKFFADWQKRDILRCDEKQGIYIYVQSFQHNGRRRTRTGFIVLLKLEDFAKNTILPHEHTFSQPVQDRLRLLKACHANLSPIFALFADPEGKINKLLSQHKAKHRPYITFKKDRATHRLWQMSDKRKIAAIKKLLKGRQIFIADGHHRYEAALNYKTHYNYVMTYLAATSDRGLTILPTHRVVRIKPGFSPEKIIPKLKDAFALRRHSSSNELFSYLRKNRASRIFGAYLRKNKFCTLKLKRTLHEDLDVGILHSFIIEHILNVTACGKNIYYTRDAQEAIKLVDEDKYQMAFFLKPPTVTQVKRVARQGARMPHKSTYFYPKLLTGLVINQFKNAVI